MGPTDDARRDAARTAALAVVTADRGGRRAFVDATGAAVPLPAAVRRVVAAHAAVGALLRELGAPLVGSAGTVPGVAAVGEPPDPRAVADLRPDVVVSAASGGALDLPGPLVAALRRTAAVVAVDLSRPEAARADLRALFGATDADRRPAPDAAPAPVVPPPYHRTARRAGG
jgi:ABC-type Fe3+-hydroxamate transport system substrate-binding protein